MDIATTPAKLRPPLSIDRARLLRSMRPDDYLAAVEAAFRAHAEGRTSMPMPLHIDVEGGGFHAKGAFVSMERAYVAVKVNSNFPSNPSKGLPTIQGAVLLYDATHGTLLAILDSAEITSKRTAAASALAARHLARTDARTLAICGCGEQGRAQLAAIMRVRPIERAFAWDGDLEKARDFAKDMAALHGIEVTAAAGLRDATLHGDIIVTATSSTCAFLGIDDVRAGAFIAAIGADNPHKNELHPDLFDGTKVVVDNLDQASAMGDLHHALCRPGRRNAATARGPIVHAELADVVVGRKPGRTNDTEITIFDSTGLAIQDVASAAAAYERCVATQAPCAGPRTTMQ